MNQKKNNKSFIKNKKSKSKKTYGLSLPNDFLFTNDNNNNINSGAYHLSKKKKKGLSRKELRKAKKEMKKKVMQEHELRKVSFL